MEDIKYHPLVTDGGPDMVPLFCTPDKASVKNKFYLEEIIPHYYRLCSRDALFDKNTTDYKIHCPYCGKVLNEIASPYDSHKHALYACKDCSAKKNI